eukprot:582133-Amphidinium_carterae.1
MQRFSTAVAQAIHKHRIASCRSDAVIGRLAASVQGRAGMVVGQARTRAHMQPSKSVLLGHLGNHTNCVRAASAGDLEARELCKRIAKETSDRLDSEWNDPGLLSYLFSTESRRKESAQACANVTKPACSRAWERCSELKREEIAIWHAITHRSTLICLCCLLQLHDESLQPSPYLLSSQYHAESLGTALPKKWFAIFGGDDGGKADLVQFAWWPCWKWFQVADGLASCICREGLESAALERLADIHGQLRDLLLLLRAFGFPKADDNMSFVFNGDFVDRGNFPCMKYVSMCLIDTDDNLACRGKHQLAVIGLLLALKVEYPDKEHVLPSTLMCKVFESNVDFPWRRLIGDVLGPKLYDLMENVFDQLPVACLISEPSEAMCCAVWLESQIVKSSPYEGAYLCGAWWHRRRNVEVPSGCGVK